jgi:hypothetical protein
VNARDCIGSDRTRGEGKCLVLRAFVAATIILATVKESRVYYSDEDRVRASLR